MRIYFPGGFARPGLAGVVGSLAFVLLAGFPGGVCFASRGCCGRVGLGPLRRQGCLQDGVRWDLAALWGGVGRYGEVWVGGDVLRPWARLLGYPLGFFGDPWLGSKHLSSTGCLAVLTLGTALTRVGTAVTVVRFGACALGEPRYGRTNAQRSIRVRGRGMLRKPVLCPSPPLQPALPG